jgi:uncharacterized protein (TIGR04255 family)
MKLPNAPLKEVIFEIFWDDSMENGNTPVDQGFELALGVFANKIQTTHPRIKKIFPDNFPLSLMGKTTHQFWQDEMTWPVVQLGPGVMAINDTDKSYDWENGYFDLIKNCLKYLYESYNSKINIKQLQLKYIDAVDLPPDADCNVFLRDNLRIELKNHFKTPSTLSGFQINQSFILDDGSSISLTVNDAINNMTQKKSIVWTTTITSKEIFDFDGIISWLQKAHSSSSTMFKDMINPKFYQTFL